MGSVLVSHPFGNQNVRALLKGLQDGRYLHSFFTSVNIPSRAPWLKCLPEVVRLELMRRSYELPEDVIRSKPLREVIRQLSQRSGWKARWPHSLRWSGVEAICQDLDRWVSRSLMRMTELPEVVYCYEDAASETFSRAGKLGIRRAYEIAIGHYATVQRLMKEESELMPEFASTIESLSDSPEKLRRKDEELAQADLIVACSDFVRQTLLNAGVSAHKIVMVQFGSPETVPLVQKRQGEETRPFRLLFAGRIGQRKGIGYLLKAMQKLNRTDVELVLIGEIVGDRAAYRPYENWFRYESPRPHAGVLELMQSCDMLVLPTLFEGQALVILEAMRCGLPVLTTPNSGAEKLIEDGVQGFIVPIRSVEALVEKIAWAADHRELVVQMGLEARKRAEECRWDGYATAILSAII